MRTSRLLAGAAAATALALLAASVPAQTVGTTGAVNPSSTGTPPGGSERTLKIGVNVVFKERIRTTPGGSLQVIFVDTTTLSVGPSSDLVIDQFVYDPNAGSGTFVASMSKGALRFVGGQISHRRGATINTPSATIGIRGGGAYIEVSPGKTAVVCTLGECVVDTPASPAVELAPGQGATSGDGQTQRFAASPGSLKAFQNSLATGKRGSASLTEGSKSNGAGSESQTGDPADNPNATTDIQNDIIDDSQDSVEGASPQEPEPESPPEPEPPDPPDPPPSP